MDCKLRPSVTGYAVVDRAYFVEQTFTASEILQFPIVGSALVFANVTYCTKLMRFVGC